MSVETVSARRADAAALFNQSEPSQTGASIAQGVDEGLSILRELLFRRVHNDIIERVGADSMLLPVSLVRSERVVRLEIDSYQIAVSADMVNEHGYVNQGSEWYVDWLTKLRFPESDQASHAKERLREYLPLEAEQQRLLFTDKLAEEFPPSTGAPLVLFRLFPLAVHAATALAFGDHFAAAEVRNRQVALLPAIADCHQCHGRLLENGEPCRECENPLWGYDWLIAAD